MEEVEIVLRIVHHRAVHVSHSIVLEPWAGAFSRMTTLTYWTVRTGILKETSSETLCSVGVEEVDVQIFRRSSDDVEVTC